MLYQDDPWTGTALHLAAMRGRRDVVEMLLLAPGGVDVGAVSVVLDRSWSRPGRGPTALHITLDTDAFYYDRDTLGHERLCIAEMLLERGADVRGVADHFRMEGVAKHFKGHEEL